MEKLVSDFKNYNRNSVEEIQFLLTQNIIYENYGKIFDNYIPDNLETISRKLLLKENQMLKDLWVGLLILLKMLV